ncbi:GyrI-like domain-containing protein [Aquimarina muelleri]|uniref:Transcriptional regulator n=1 Tax=Aquimarina muelleri TaxID=279356 RepID=A0A918JYT4_9FLAO|nr:GyrI-like domain-containing protein [Aquimarina muelleri]MCX2763845.1 GyrI-like domain-containing protein [Aquimarina muelleri]GGX29344.1 transcriptional regulator [Aquimarina muelleri]
MEKLDLKKQYKAYYNAKNKPELLIIEKAQFLSITGIGDPSGKVFSHKVQALYATAYAVKFLCKALNNDFVVAKLQGQWSFDENKHKGLSMEEASLKVPRSEWNYRIMIRMPEFVTREQLISAIQTVVTKKQIQLATDIEFYEMEEGKVVQMLHVGPFANEPETLKQIQEYMKTNNLKRNGLHHEIYLSDFNKIVPHKLKTILREPVK